MQDCRTKPPIFVQKNQAGGTYRYADDETWCEDLLDPKADEKAKQKKEAQLKLHMVSGCAVRQPA